MPLPVPRGMTAAGGLGLMPISLHITLVFIMERAKLSICQRATIASPVAFRNILQHSLLDCVAILVIFVTARGHSQAGYVNGVQAAAC